MDDEGIPPQAGERRSGEDAGGTVERDVGEDEGRDQAAWRDLVARLELPTPVDLADAPWPDRENLGQKPARNQTSTGPDHVTTQEKDATASPAGDRGTSSSTKHDKGPPDRTRVIRPAGFTKFCGPAGGQAGTQAPGSASGPAWPAGEVIGPAKGQAIRPSGQAFGPTPWPAFGSADSGIDGVLGSPRDYQVADEDDFPDGYEDERYIPPPLPPLPKLDPIAKGAWIALFGGPGYLLLATLLGWQLAGWSELAAVIAFVAGFVVLVFRLGDGPSKKDGPDQGAVV